MNADTVESKLNRTAKSARSIGILVKFAIFIVLFIIVAVIIYKVYNWWKDFGISSILKGADVANLDGSKPLKTDGIPRVCESGKSLDAGLCYKNCSNSTYKRVGPVCWQTCPSGFKDTGVSCLKPASYGRGAGYVSESICKSKTSKSCEKNGLLWYPKCKSGFHNVGCCTCSPDCPNGMDDAGISCTKKTETIGAGTIPTLCPTGDIKVGALCYKNCDSGYYRDLLLCKKCDGLTDDDKKSKGCIT